MNILIVDDDIMIRNLLSMLIQQTEDFACRVASVASADEAELYCENNPIDLVITDITMPKRSGLDLIRELRKKHPAIQIACLSAYDDYDYIREALKLGVLDYILKSEMRIDDIVSLLVKMEAFSNIADDSLPPQAETDRLNDINAMMAAYLDDDDLKTEEICQRVDCKPYDSVIVVAFRLQKQGNEPQDMVAVQRIAEKTRESEQLSGISFLHESDRLIMIIKNEFDSMESRENEMMKLSLLFQRNLTQYNRQNVMLSMYEVSERFSQLRRTIVKTMDIMDAYEYYPEYKTKRVPLKNLNENDVNALGRFARIEAGQVDMRVSSQSFIRQIGAWHDDYMTPREIKSSAVCGLFYIMEGSGCRDVKGLLDYNRYAIRIRYAQNRHELETVLQDALDSILQCHGAQASISSAPIRAAVEYIDKNYDRKITLDDIAKHIFLNRTYTSQMFKKYMNVNFADYVEMVRINKAKELLLFTNSPITEIAAKIGYSNQSYFTKVFKQNTGMSPNAFRSISRE